MSSLYQHLPHHCNILSFFGPIDNKVGPGACMSFISQIILVRILKGSGFYASARSICDFLVGWLVCLSSKNFFPFQFVCFGRLVKLPFTSFSFAAVVYVAWLNFCVEKMRNFTKLEFQGLYGPLKNSSPCRGMLAWLLTTLEKWLWIFKIGNGKKQVPTVICIYIYIDAHWL